MRIQHAAMAFAAAVLLTTSLFAAEAKSAPVLETADQKAVETVALALRNAPAIKAARAAAIKRYLAAPPGALEDGRKTVEGATDEMVWGVLLAVADDPANPKLVWTETLPRTVGKRSLPGSRSANPPLYTTSMDVQQSRYFGDGSVTYVVSPKDPGIYNWIDTGDLHGGIVVIRRELLTDKAVREVRKLKLSEVALALPAEAKCTTPDEPTQQLAERLADYNARLAR